MKKIFTLSLFAVFFVICAIAAVFTSIASGNFNTPGIWAVTGADADGVPDNNDDVIVAGTHTITLTTSSNVGSLTTNSGGVVNLNGLSMLVWGNLTNNGSTMGLGSWQFRAPGTYS